MKGYLRKSHKTYKELPGGGGGVSSLYLKLVKTVCDS